MASIPASISDASYDHGTRVVAFAAKDTTEKRAASGPRENMCTRSLAKAFSPLGPSIEPLGLGFFIEPLSSITRAKSSWYAQGGLGDGGGGDGDGEDEGGRVTEHFPQLAWQLLSYGSFLHLKTNSWFFRSTSANPLPTPCSDAHQAGSLSTHGGGGGAGEGGGGGVGGGALSKMG